MDQIDEAAEAIGPWIRDLAKWAGEHKKDIMMVKTGEDSGTVYLVGNSTPDEDSRLLVTSMVPPTYSVEFKESVRADTMQKLALLMASAMCLLEPPKISNHSIQLNIHAMPLLKDAPLLWDTVGKILEGDDYVTRYEIFLNGEIIKSNSREMSKASDETPNSDMVHSVLEGSNSIDDFLNSGLFNGGVQ